MGVAGDASDGAVPGDGDAGPLRPHPVRGTRAGSRPTSRSTRAPPTGRCWRSCRPSSTSQLDLWAVPVRRGRRDRRRRQGRRLLAGDADQAGVRPDAGRGDAGPRALAHVVRRLGDADRVAGHLAARGLRHLVGVDLERAPRSQVGAQQLQDSSTTRPPRTPPSGRRRRATRAAPRSCSTERSTTGAG